MPEQLKQLCKQYGLTPSKQYGQHFLISDAPINKMIAAAELTNDDTVIEIGPGFGVLTFAIAPLVKKVIAFEIEKKLEDYWTEKLKDQKIGRSEDQKIEIVWGDALSHITYHISRIKGPYKVLANLPYQITSHALRTMLELPHKPERIIVMVQKEVAEKICAKPARLAEDGKSRQGNMSLLSVSVQYYGTPKIIAKVPKGCFWPVPKVDSAVIEIKDIRKDIKDIEDGEDMNFFRLVKAGFAHKRKQLWRNLADGFKLSPDTVKSALVEVVGNEKARAEEVGVEEWQELVERLS